MIDPKEVAMKWKGQPAFADISADLNGLACLVFESGDVERTEVDEWFTKDLPTWYPWTPLALAEQWQAVVQLMEVSARTPINLEVRLERLEGSVTKLSEALLRRPVVSSTGIVDLNSVHYLVQQPIPVVVEEYAEESVATFPEVEAHGFGVTPADAINDLKEQIVVLYEDLATADPEGFGKLPTAWWRVLRHYVAKDEEI